MSGKDDPGGGGEGGGGEAGGGCRKTGHPRLVSTLCRTCDCECVYDVQGVSQKCPTQKTVGGSLFRYKEDKENFTSF